MGQIAFADEPSDKIGKLNSYRQHKIARTRLAEDGVFMGEPRDYRMHIERVDTAHFEPDATPKPVGMRPGGRPLWSAHRMAIRPPVGGVSNSVRCGLFTTSNVIRW